MIACTNLENENRQMEMFPEPSSDSEQMEQWATTAKLQWLEVERIEALLAEMEKPSDLPRSDE